LNVTKKRKGRPPGTKAMKTALRVK